MANLNHSRISQLLTEKSIAKIVSSFASRPDATIQEIVDLSNRLAAEQYSGSNLVQGGPESTQAPNIKMAAVIPIEKAVTTDRVYCLCCGKGFSMLKRHLGAEHGLSEAQYREMFSLEEDFPLVAPSYSERKAAHAKRIGLGKHTRD